MTFFNVKTQGTVAFSAMKGYTDSKGQTNFSLSINQTQAQIDQFKKDLTTQIQEMSLTPEEKKWAYDYLTKVITESNPEKTALPFTSYFNVAKTIKLYEQNSMKVSLPENELATDLPVTLNIVFSDEVDTYMNNKFLKGYRVNGVLADEFKYYQKHVAFDGFEDTTQSETPKNDEPNPFATSGTTPIDISDDDLPF